jgi:hypothetical protein
MSQPYFERVWGWDSHFRNGTWESFEAFKTLKFNCKGQNTLPWGVFHIIGKLSKYRCQKWSRMNHLDICSTQIGNLTPDHLKLGIDSTPTCAGRVQHIVGKFSRRATSLLQTSPQSEVWAKSYDLTKSWEFKPGQFRNSTLRVPGQKAIRVWVRRSNAENTIWGKMLASPESGPWWVL